MIQSRFDLSIHQILEPEMIFFTEQYSSKFFLLNEQKDFLVGTVNHIEFYDQ